MVKYNMNKYRERYEKQKLHGAMIDHNMEHSDSADVQNGCWIMVILNVSVENPPLKYGIYWGMPYVDKFDRQCCKVVTNGGELVLLNHEYTVITDGKLAEYRDLGWELHLNNPSSAEEPSLLNEIPELTSEETEIVGALMLDGLTKIQALEEYVLGRHKDTSNSLKYFIPGPQVLEEIRAVFG